MSAEAVIFDLSAFGDAARQWQAEDGAGTLGADQLLDDAVDQGCHCALVTDLPHREAEQRLRQHFGDRAHHIFSVVLTGADYSASDHRAPYSIVLRTLDLYPDHAQVVADSPQALQAARRARLAVRRAA